MAFNRKELARYTLDELRRVIPQPQSELAFVNKYQLIVAVILSAQCTDERVNKITPPLFNAYPTFSALAEAIAEEVVYYIGSVSYPNNKSRHLVRMAQRVQEVYGGQLPRTQLELMTLPGVGRKTAQVVSSVAFDDHTALPVDTHVFRVANRIGLVRNAPTPIKVERGLKAILPRGSWGEAHHLLILHGRYMCTARKPKCDACVVAPRCRYNDQRNKLPARLGSLDKDEGKYFCKTRNYYFSEAVSKQDRYGTEQIACPSCGSMNVYFSKTGETTKKVRDYRVEKAASRARSGPAAIRPERG